MYNVCRFCFVAIFNHRCGAGLFNCSHTECISSNKLCDGYQDCLTNVGADEDSSICRKFVIKL